MKFKNILSVFTCALLSAGITQVAVAADISPEETSATSNDQCGIIALYQKPPEAKNTYYALINTIDGKTVSSYSDRFALTPGKHQIKIIEKINNSDFTRRRGEMKNFKFIELTVEANKQYALGAKFIRKNRSKLRTGEYWQPVVWKTTDVNCKM